ncbi:DNA polymerase III subunit epsilon [Pseudomarimonas arenosa]|uniref:DNA polymerase III subunit epsilon n=1 Tax=Pseudomarimonas arenosa TaxID=2774145 RepID=A0AAW3ZJV1_9GAMM|nr:DNA polymerase III subunit epsilon [Pseudomarimonas arenosa]MBD8526043.1 DNA polymerase III subunit epsilon [Pseudomarimonas arenosa]
MRQVVLDTETTGLAVEKGHRLVEIGCLELLERRPSGRRFQRYLNPERSMDIGASEVTGLTDEFLADKPLFVDVVESFLTFVRGAELIIHNAAFDVGFIDAELARAGRSERLADICTITDSLGLAREKYPGQRNSLDALCKRLGVDNAHRSLHGALLDAELLAEVYLALTSGQTALFLDPTEEAEEAAMAANDAPRARPPGIKLRLLQASADELAAHRRSLAGLAKGGRCLWAAEDEDSTAVLSVA